MKLSKLQPLGRFRHTKTSQTVNLHQGQKLNGAPVIFYLYRQSRHYIAEGDFYSYWKPVQQ